MKSFATALGAVGLLVLAGCGGPAPIVVEYRHEDKYTIGNATYTCNKGPLHMPTLRIYNPTNASWDLSQGWTVFWATAEGAPLVVTPNAPLASGVQADVRVIACHPANGYGDIQRVAYTPPGALEEAFSVAMPA